jgi:hypothetical protein
VLVLATIDNARFRWLGMARPMENRSAMKLPLAFASLFVATTAYAQAPGDEGGAVPGEYEATAAPGMVAPVVVVPPPPPPKPRRWSVGLGIGSLSLAPHVAPEQETEFGIGQIAVRYLATRHLEIELAFGGGREQLEDGQEGDRQVSQGVLALRYRFNPARRWNFWLMAGMGGLAVTRTEPTKEEREAAEQSTLQFGAGLERRWSRFALQLELRAVGVKAHDVEEMPVRGEVTDPNGSMTPLPPEKEPTTTSAHDGMSGGQMVLSGNYYF